MVSFFSSKCGYQELQKFEKHKTVKYVIVPGGKVLRHLNYRNYFIVICGCSSR